VPAAGIRAKYPSLPEEAVASANYSDSTANGLTRAIVAYIGFIGGWATRVTSTGRMIDKGTEVRAKMVYIPGTTKRGTADIMGVIRGKAISIEVKIGKDRQSKAQRQVEQSVSDAGGLYYVARNFQDTYDWINQL
jgi:hypothetical protein